MRELKLLGAHNVLENRPRGLTGKKSLQGLVQAYEIFRTTQGLLPATYEVVYGHAWGSEIKTDSEVSIPIKNIKIRDKNHFSSL